MPGCARRRRGCLRGVLGHQHESPKRVRQVRLGQGAREPGRARDGVTDARLLRRGMAAAFAAAALIGLTPALASAATADLGLDLSDNPDPVTAGAELTYAIEATNAGPDAATEVQVADDLPSQIDFVSATPSH